MNDEERISNSGLSRRMAAGTAGPSELPWKGKRGKSYGKDSHLGSAQSDIQSDAWGVTLKLRPVQYKLETQLAALIGKTYSGIPAQAVDTLKAASKTPVSPPDSDATLMLKNII